MPASKRKLGDKEKYQEKDAKRRRMELKKPVRLMDLPMAPLHLIFSKVPLKSLKLLRNASKEMRDEHTEFLLHHYKSFSHKLSNNKRINKVELCIYKVVDEATAYLEHFGYVYGLLYHLALNKVDVAYMQKLLHTCYHRLEFSASERLDGVSGRILLHRRRLVFMVTLLNLLRQFRGYRLVSSQMNILHWKLHIEVPGAHIIAQYLTVKEEYKLIDLMSLIAELLVYDMSDTSTGPNHYIDIGHGTYNYGFKRQPSGRGARLGLKFSILAPLAVRNLMEDALAGKVDKSTAVKCPLVDSFSIQLELRNYGVNNWVEEKNWQICILPLF